MLLGEEVVQNISASDFPDIVMYLCSSINNDLFNLFILGCWRLWSNRNCVIHGAVGWIVADLVAWVDNFASDFRVANEPNHKEILSHQPTWKPPELREFKINWDASFRLRSGTAGVGVIIRNYKGTAIAAKSSPVLGCNSIEMLEAHACLVGLQLAIDVGIFGMVLESDAEGVVRLLSDHIVPRTEMGAIICSSLDLGRASAELPFR
ncbi:hypothetical protein Q3G72_024241 [Acer saccharum]|nr:hypothetical protein Q3G72_024241 [Acer saccharum]